MSQKDALINYIDRQEQHHQTQSFQDEYREFLTKYGVGYTEQYLWD